MPDSFEPYLNWFGIPPSDQPLDHYRLLGLELFEDSQSKIEDAVADRAEFLQTVSMGEHVAAAQRILNEVARARICLVNLDKKRAYDQQLREQAASPKLAEPIPMALTIDQDGDTENALQDLQIALENRKTKSGRRKTIQLHPDDKVSRAKNSQRQNASKKWLTAAAAGIVVCLIAATTGVILSGMKDDPRTSQLDIENALDELQLPSLRSPAQTRPKAPAARLKNGADSVSPSNNSKTGASGKNRKRQPKKKNDTVNRPKPNAKPNAKPDTRPKPDLPKPKSTTAASLETPSGDQPAVKNPPPKSKLAKTQPLKKVPESSLTFPKAPFKYFKKQFLLPALQNVQEVKIDDLFLKSDAPLEVELIYDRSLSKARDNFRLRKSKDKERSWIISREITKDNLTIDIAKISTAGFALYFQWLPAAKEDEDSNYLRNGVLKFAASDAPPVWVNLRNTKTIQGFQFSEGKYLVKDKTELTWLPNSKSLRIELLPFPKQIAKSFCDPKLVTNKPGLMYFVQDNPRRFLWLEASGSVRQNKLSIDAKLKILDTQGRPRGFTLNILEDQILTLVAVVKQTQAMIAAAKEKAQKERLGSRIEAERKLLATARSYAETVSNLHDQNIGIRVFYEVQDHQVVIARTAVPRGPAVRGRVAKISELADYQVVYDMDLNGMSKEIQYDLDFSNAIGKFDRIGYLLELASRERGQQFVFVTVDAFTKDAKKIGIPTVKSKAQFQQSLQSMNVYSNVEGLTTGQKIATGNIEFWPNNYGPNNAAKVENASDKVSDFGDQNSNQADYGSMQIHNFGAKQTLFAINNWKAGKNADIGIGNSLGQNPDWTFRKNAGQYGKKRLRVYVRPN